MTVYARENRDVTFGTPGGVEIADFSDGAPLEFIQWLTPASTSIYILYLHRVKPASSLEKEDQQMHKDPAIRYPGSVGFHKRSATTQQRTPWQLQVKEITSGL